MSAGMDEQESPTKKRHNRQAEDVDAQSTASSGTRKRRRKAFSCLSCQKLKCRCDFDVSVRACRRCHNLRIHCSLSDEQQPHVEKNDGQQTVEDRLSAVEGLLSEIQNMLKNLTSAMSTSGDAKTKQPLESEAELNRTDAPRCSGDASVDPEQIHEAADHAIISAPIAVLRDIGRHYTGEPRRPLCIQDADLIDAQLLNHQSADELIEIFFRYESHMFHLSEVTSVPTSEGMKGISSFLHGVCCLNAMALCSDTVDLTLHQNVYRRIRACLGQVLLSAPLTLEDIQAVFILTDHQMSPFGSENDYIDSWMLTGYCAKQAMLSISFSDIVNHIRNGQPDSKDRAAIRLWSAICQSHLRWSATTGRPSIIPDPYVSQCNALLSFYEASTQDGMMLAEILLSSSLLKKIGTVPTINSVGECIEFDGWKRQWGHLLSLPNSSILSMSLHMSCLILIIGSLQKLGEELSSEALLHAPSTDAPRNARLEPHRRSASHHASMVLQSFFDPANTVPDSVGTNRCLCIVYSAVIMAYYDESIASDPRSSCLTLISRVGNWCGKIPGKPWAAKFSGFAQAIVNKRLSTQASTEMGSTTNQEPYYDVGMLSEDAIWAQPPTLAAMDSILSSMESFFGGQYLD